ncbi:MAG: DNA sulfur modification protein DndB [Gammaproteobacteria bacterium]|nr:DNA sulfur modification protein DndB [Gammaproteobacteria bacterium]
MDTEPALTFPVIRGLQARREYYVAMWTLRMLRQIAIFDEDELPPELRAQRTLNRARIPEISEYILNNPDDYVFSAITVSIDSEVSFEPLPGESKLGILRVPMDARFIINDGQHRRAAIIEALEDRPELAHETIAVVFFLDIGLERCQQMFADLNRYAIRPSRSLGLLYDHRDDKAGLAKLVVMKSEIFRDIVDMEKSSLAKRSRKLFTLSAFYNACADLVDGMATGNLNDDAALARDYWEAVALEIPAWIRVREGTMAASEVREGYIHSHGIALQALGQAGNALLLDHPNHWRERLAALRNIDWSRSNVRLWEGRTLVGGRVIKGNTNLVLTTNVIKHVLGLPLNTEQQKVEDAYKEGQEKITLSRAGQ